MSRLFPLSLFLLLGLILPVSGIAWEDPQSPPKDEAPLLPKLKVGGLFGKPVGGGDGKELTLTGEFKVAEGGHDGILTVKAVLGQGWHTYSITQSKGKPGPVASKLTIQSSEQLSTVGTFVADREPKVRDVEGFSVPVEEHEEEVIWTAPITLAKGADPKELVLKVKFDGQVCTDGIGGIGGTCKPVDNVIVEAKYAGVFDAPPPAERSKSEEPFRLPSTKLTLRGTLDKATVAPGGKVKLLITATPDPEWHVYALEKSDPKLVSKPTLIVFKETAGLQVGEPVPSAPPKVKKTRIETAPEAQFHVDPITWTTEISIPSDATTGSREVSGFIGFQTCKDTSCLPPSVAEFRVKLTIGDVRSSSALPLTFQEADKKTGYTKVAELAASRSTPGGFDVGLTQANVKNEVSEWPVYYAIPVALLGGFILNFMPCVLPVIGLKIMSFVQQAGESRARVVALNVSYSIGMLAVFMVLATLLVVWNLAWGTQNQNESFNITMIAVVFAMGLSFLGVWEIPIPGFVGSGKASELAQKEGLLGAFFKGAITTVLATPCSGPGITTALQWCKDKPPVLVYLVFAFLALGMALPYLIIGTNPRLVKMLPKPGAWMDTFKQAMGFVLLATVVYLFSFLRVPLLVPTIALIFGLWAAFWWIGRTPITAEWPQTLRAWATGAVIATAIGWFSLTWLVGTMESRFSRVLDKEISQRQTAAADLAKKPKSEHELDWKAFSVEKLKTLTAEKKTVMVDFTADWCPTCIALEATVLNTKAVKQVVDEYQVETLVADWTEKDPVIRDVLNALKSDDIPVLAIFPAGKPNEPIVLRGGYTQSMLIKSIESAVGAEKKGATTANSKDKYDLPWKPFSPERLETLKSEKKTVLVNYTADWDPVFKALESTVLNTKEVKKAVDKHHVETMVADWTTKDSQISDSLEALGSKQIPALAIYPAGRPNEPIVLLGGYTKEKLIRSIEEAAKSKTSGRTAAMK